MPTSTLTSKGQITLPKAIRELFHLAPGDVVDFVVSDDGRVELRPVTRRVREAYGLLYRADRPPVSVEAMDEAIAESIVEALADDDDGDDRDERESDDESESAGESRRR